MNILAIFTLNSQIIYLFLILIDVRWYDWSGPFQVRETHGSLARPLILPVSKIFCFRDILKHSFTDCYFCKMTILVSRYVRISQRILLPELNCVTYLALASQNHSHIHTPKTALREKFTLHLLTSFPLKIKEKKKGRRGESN